MSKIVNKPTMTKYVFIFLIPVLLLLSCRQRDEKNRQEQSANHDTLAISPNRSIGAYDFIFTFEYNGKLCIRGKYPIGIKVALIQDKILYATTSDTGSVNDEYADENNFTFTSLIVPQNIILKDSVCLGVLNPEVSNYESIQTSIVTDTSIINHLSSISRKSNIVDTLLARNSGAIYSLRNDISPSLPEVIKFADNSVAYYILSYKMIFGQDGPRVLVTNDSVYPLTGQCSHKTSRIFRLNGELLYESGSACCECGITGYELFKLSSAGTHLIYADYSWSD